MPLTSRLLLLRSSPVLLKLPPYLSTLCLVIGIAWLFILPLDLYSRHTYVSENAILPGQVTAYFGGSEHNIFRAYRQEVFQLAHKDDLGRAEGVEELIKEMGLKVARQHYRFAVAGDVIGGENVYGLLQGPRADATESMVLMAAWRNFDGDINYSGVALALTLARFFKRFSIWSKDIIILIPADSTHGPEAWASAYHSTALEATNHRNISALTLKAGALQGAVALDYPAGPWGHRFDKLDILYDGINGALPNLDLLNTAIEIASGQMGIDCILHGMQTHSDSYTDRLRTMVRGLVTQSVGQATGPHSAFVPYHVDAITLKTVGDGWQDEMSLGRTTESIFRSINNLLEHFHQSFFFYILLNSRRFISIGNYLPAAMLIAGNFTIAALALWLQSGKSAQKPTKLEIIKDGKNKALVPKEELETVEREIFLPAAVVLAVTLSGFLPVYLLSITPKSNLETLQHNLTALGLAVPLLAASILLRLRVTPQQLQLMQSFSLLVLGAALSTLATLNFSLAFGIGVVCAPLSLIAMLHRRTGRVGDITCLVIHSVISPALLPYAVSWYMDKSIQWVLTEVVRGWAVQGVYTAVIIWALWWPAWVVCGIALWRGIQ
ncbi:Gaa1-like protein [Piedraia hortae CBS 480.64]|uniref:Gaa1-like protein n=1 Tax=Piedraia hortae CBS 480.64 TaxID=1314780 RepID=A0A6A7C4N7_9PEZI|nr:Gaa1-like protein [Piedraia hortae CBS 480.64]